MKGLKLTLSSIAMASLVAACGTTSGASHRSEAKRYEEAARLARSRGASTEAARDEALARKQQAEAREEEELSAYDPVSVP